ncbi:uncharacterized protein LOC132498442 isoform X3 [Mesoplodon densirostris]|uniref:uncharacterized protein LOC132498442 isoform X3 n=1 Tax=Mesoplodon densirostris TaxID=48708 RepID=UPI0028DC1FB0|nr:uncharacterized protein LOC132498442 isoform X3 [Mesoplodon densirostris]
MEQKRYLQRLKMVFGLCCQRERLYKFLYVVNIFILAGVVYYYFQGCVGKTAPDHEITREASQPLGETLRPVWGLMDKCYPVTAQRRRVKSGEKQDSEAMTPKATGGPNDAAPKEETDILSSDEGEMRSPGEEAGSPIPSSIPAGKEENKKVRKEIAAYTSEASEVDLMEERPGGWVPQLLRKLWLGWSPASDIPKTQSHE